MREEQGAEPGPPHFPRTTDTPELQLVHFLDNFLLFTQTQAPAAPCKAAPGGFGHLENLLS